MHVSVIVILASFLLTSCISIDDRVGKAIVGGAQTIGVLAAASVQFREENGQWPTTLGELMPLLTDPSIDLQGIEQVLSFRATPRGLAFVNQKSGKTAIVVANESTKEHLVVTGG